MHYIWDKETDEVKPADLLKWAIWFENNDRRVAVDDINGVRISTVFLGTDHSWLEDEPPLLFETMIFGGEHDEYQERHTTADEARAGHDRAVRIVKDN